MSPIPPDIPEVVIAILPLLSGHAMDMAPGAASMTGDTTGSGNWNYYLVALSYAVAVLASYVTLDVGEHSLEKSGLRKVALLASASVLMGFGIWTMHFTGMLASTVHQGVRYDVLLTVLSLVFAIGASAVAFSIVGFLGARLRYIVCAAPIMGGGIVAMHYTGMAAMYVTGEITYRAGLTALSVLIAVVASAAAMYLTFGITDLVRSSVSRTYVRVTAALVMGLAVCGMHYTGMSAVVMRSMEMDSPGISGGSEITGSTNLGLIVSVAVLLLLLGAILVSEVNRRMSDQQQTLRRYEERARSILEQINEGYFELDLRGRVTEANNAIVTRGAWRREDIIGRDFLSIAAPEEREGLEEALRVLLESGEPLKNYGCRMLTSSGEENYLEVSAVQLYARPGVASGVRGVMRNVTGRRKSEAALKESEERFRSLFDQSVDALILHDEFGEIVDCNSESCRALGYEKSDLLGMNIRDIATQLLSGDTDGNATDEPTLWQRAISGTPGKIIGYHFGEHIRKDGTRFPVEVGVGAFRVGEQQLIFASARDITERRMLEEKLAYQATHDSLTNLPNRRLFNERLAEELGRTRPGSGVGILFLDLDNFKVVNDSLGHDLGDRLLVAASERLQASIPAEAMISRFGGDEFTIFIPDVEDQATIVKVASDITDAFQRSFNLEGRELFASTSIGAALGDANNSPEDVLRQADLALYRAKANGNSRFELFNENMNQQTMSRLDLELDLRRALRNSEMSVWYQPIIDLHAGSIDGFEALARWNHPIRGNISPGEFIPLAEETGLIHQIGHFVLKSACTQLSEWQRDHAGDDDLKMSVNLSVKQLQDPSLAHDIENVIREAGIRASSLTLEITESILMQEMSQGIDTLLQLRELGINIAIDDFGTGYSSLSQLRTFPVNVLKIDRSFVNGIERGTEDRAIVETVIGLASALELSVVAEGIETSSQFDYLSSMNCDYGQGFFLTRPLEVAAAGELLKSTQIVR